MPSVAEHQVQAKNVCNEFGTLEGRPSREARNGCVVGRNGQRVSSGLNWRVPSGRSGRRCSVRVVWTGAVSRVVGMVFLLLQGVAFAATTLPWADCAEPADQVLEPGETIDQGAEARRIIELCERATEADPEDGEAWAALSVAYEMAGRDADAIGAGIEAIRSGHPNAAHAVLPVLRALQVGNAREFRRALAELGGIGPIVSLLNRVAEADYRDFRVNAVEALGAFGGPEAVKGLAHALVLAKDDGDLRAKAAEALESVAEPRAIEVFIGMLADEDAGVRKEIVSALGVWGDARAVEPLVAMLEDEDADVRKAAIRALVKFEDPRTVAPLIGRLTEEGADVRLPIVEALGKWEERRAVEPLIELLSEGDAELRSTVAKALGKLRDPRAVEPLIGLLAEENSGLQEAVTGALGKLGDGRAVEPLVALLGKQDEDIRRRAMGALGELRDPRAVEPLVERLADEGIDGQLQAVEALTKLRDPRSVEALISALVADHGLKLRDMEFMEKCPTCFITFASMNMFFQDDEDAQEDDEAEDGIVELFSKYWLQGTAAAGLYALRPPRIGELLLAALSDADPARDSTVRFFVGGLLLEAGEPHAYRLLVEVLAAADADTESNSFYHTRSTISEAVEASSDLGAIGPLARMLTDENFRVRINAAKLLSDISRTLKPSEADDASAMDPLVSLLDHAEFDVRRSAAVALAEFGDARAKERLFEMLDVGDSYERGRAALSLGAMNDSRAVEPLIALLAGADSRLRSAAASTLGTMGDARAVEPLVALLTDEDTEFRSTLMEALGELGDERAVEPLIALLTDETVEFRSRVTQALGALRDVRAVEPLVAHLSDEEAESRSEALVTLEEVGAAREAEPLITLLNREDSEFRSEVARTLGALGDVRAVKPLIALLTAESVEFRSEVVRTLGALGDPEAVEPLVALLTAESVEFRSEVVRTLGALGDPEAVEPLVALLTDEDAEFRVEVVRALGVLGDVRAVEPLLGLLTDEVDDIRRGASMALGATGDARAVDPLIAQLADKDEYVRTAAAWALAELRDVRVVEPLVASLVLDEDAFNEGTRGGGFTLVVNTSPYDARDQVVSALVELGDMRAARPLLALHSHDAWEFALPALTGLEAFGHEAVQKAVSNAIPGFRLLPAVSRVHDYHRGLLYCVQHVAENSTYGRRLDLLQAVWRWRDIDTPGLDGTEIAGELDGLTALSSQSDAPSPYTMLLAAILAANAKRFSEAGRWAGLGLEYSEEHELDVRVALSVIRSEALVARNRPAEALSVLEATEPLLSSHYLRDAEQASSFLPQIEFILTKAFVLSNLGYHRQVIETGYQAESIILSRISSLYEGQVERFVEMRLAPLQQEALGRERDWYLRKSRRSLEGPPRGIQEEYGRALLAKAAIEKALTSEDYDPEEYETAQQELEKFLLQVLPKPATVRYANDARNAAVAEVLSLQKGIADLKSRLSAGKPEHSLRKQIHAQQAELARFVRNLKRQHADIAARWGTSPTNVGKLQDRLDPETGIVQYLVLDRESFVFLVHRDGIEIARLQRNGFNVGETCTAQGDEPGCFALKRSIDRFKALLRSGRDAGGERKGEEVAALGKALASVLLDPIAERFGRLENVVVVPNNSLHRLPWSALPWNGRFLIQQKTLTVLPAASLFGAVVARAEERPKGLFAVGNPSTVEAGWGPLEWAQAEVMMLADLFPHSMAKTILIGEDASRERVTSQDLQGHVIHFAAHAESGSTDRTRLLLSDGDLRYDDVLALDIRGAPSVVLSACETGLGELLSGDHVYSLADAFLQAQAKSVVYSLWLVNDESTKILMEEFYRQYGESTNTALALARAQRAMIKKGYPPGDWAGFVVSQWAASTP